MTHESVTAMTSAYAEQAVAAAREFHAHFDYSEKSLRELESILSKLAKAPSAGDLTEVCKMWGSYLGEVVRRRFGGDWSIETYPGKPFATLTLNVGGNKLFPTMKIHRRLTQGSEDNIWVFYEMVKTRLEAKPGGRVQ
ncbi:MAG TPA: hypothetical protein VIX19_00995 [Terriglobales bacterium]